ncbi:unnamed protein product [Sphacelaria rigidula]
MHSEFTGPLEKGTFEVVDELPGGREAIGTRWLHSWETGQDGFVTKPKARFVCLGNPQQPDINVEDLFGPTPPGLTPRVLTAYACQNKLEMYHLDVEQAFMSSPIEEKIYVRSTDGCEDLSERFVRVLGALYGLKQAGRAGNAKLVTTSRNTGLSSA